MSGPLVPDDVVERGAASCHDADPANCERTWVHLSAEEKARKIGAYRLSLGDVFLFLSGRFGR